MNRPGRLVGACILAFFALLGQAFGQASQLPLGEQCFSALAPTSGGPGGTGTGYIGLLGTVTGGTGGTAGTYSTALTGGSGSGAQANITVSGGAVTAVAVYNPGVGYVVGDTLSATPSTIGGVTGFSVPVSSVAVNQALAGGSVGYYIPGTLTPSQTWKNASQSTLNPNPIPLDANGCAIVYGSGTYRQIVQDSLGNTVWDQPTSAGLATFTISGDSFVCNPNPASGPAQGCSQAQSTALINTFTSSLSGAAPASGGGTTNFLRADGTWAQPPEPSTSAFPFLVSTNTISNLVTYGDTTSFAGACPEYDIELLNIIPATASVQLEMQIHSGGAFQTTGYIFNLLFTLSTTVTSSGTSGVAIAFTSNDQANSAGHGFSGHIKIQNVSSGTLIKNIFGHGAYTNASVQAVTTSFSGNWETGGTGAIDGFQLFETSGNLASGTVKVYCYP